MDIEEIITNILNVTYCPNNKENRNKVRTILISDSTNKETDICDILEIERRWNRSAIREFLSV